MKLELEGTEDMLSSLLVMMAFIQKSKSNKTPIILNIVVDSDDSLDIVLDEDEEKDKLSDLQLYDNVNLSKKIYTMHL